MIPIFALAAAVHAGPEHTHHDHRHGTPTQHRVVTPDGTCRSATAAEIATIAAINQDRDLTSYTRTSIGRGAARSAGLDVQFLLSPAAADDPAFVAALEQAAQIWESLIDDNVTVVKSVDFTSGQGFIAATDLSPEEVTYADIRQALIDDASTRERTYVEAAVPPDGLTFDFGFFGTIVAGPDEILGLTPAQAQALGFPDPTPGDTPDAGITFNTDLPFDTNPADGLEPNAVDIVFVMTHELGHALGFVSADDFFLPGPLDFVRVGAEGTPNDPDTLSELSVVERVIAQGGAAAIDPLQQFPGVESVSLDFSTGIFPEFGGDGRQGSHWKDQSLLGADTVIGVMDPTFEGGAGIDTLNPISEADRLAFSLIGWDIDVPAEPPTDVPCPGDTDGNDAVAAGDLLTVLTNFGEDVHPAADGDVAPPSGPDGSVNAAGLLIVLDNFGTICV